jgi:hypothetical protein
MIEISLATIKAWRSAGLYVRIVRRVRGGAIVCVGGPQ